MKVINVDIFKLNGFEPSTSCIGFFDGVHLGHQKLLAETKEIAAKHGITSAVITFDPDPHALFNKSESRHITSFSDRLRLFDSYGMDMVYVMSFDSEFASLPPESFIEILNEMNIQTLVCGFDFTFGKNGSGNVQTLMDSKLRYFNIREIEAVMTDGLKISSTRIIDCIRLGKIHEAVSMLGHSYTVRLRKIGQMYNTSSYVMPVDGYYDVIVNGKAMTCAITKDGILLPDLYEDDIEMDIVS